MSHANSNRMMFNYDGVAVDLTGVRGDYIYDYIQRNGTFYEDDMLRLISSFPVADGIFVDAGANIGNHTIFFSKILGRRVYSYEVYPFLRSIIRNNVFVNGVSGLVNVFDYGLFSHSRMVNIISESNNLGMTRIILEDVDGQDKVPLRALDDVFPQSERVAVMKVDVEGSELDVLEGARQTILRCQPICILEVHGPIAAKRAAAFFSELDYAPVGIVGLSDNWIMVPRAQSYIYEQYARIILDRSMRRELLAVRSRVEISASAIKVLHEKIERFQVKLGVIKRGSYARRGKP